MVFTVCIECKERLTEFYEYYKAVKENLESLHALIGQRTLKAEPPAFNKLALQSDASTRPRNLPQPPALTPVPKDEPKFVARTYNPSFIKQEVVEYEDDIEVEVDGVVDESEMVTGDMSDGEEMQMVTEDGKWEVEALEEAESLPEISENMSIKVYEEVEIEPEQLLSQPFNYATHAGRDLYALLGSMENRLDYLRKNGAILLAYDRRRIFYGFVCYMCQMRFSEEFDLQQHLLESHHMDKVVYRCCNTDIMPINQVDHITWHLDPESFKCPVCSRTFTCYSQLRRHFRGACGKANALCADCGEEVPSMQMYSHQKKHQKAAEANGPKPVRLSRVRTFRGVQTKSPYKCDICDRRFPKYCKIKYHIEMQHLKLFKETCELCGKSFINKYSLEGHMKLHGDVQTEECPICGRFVKRLQRHIKLNHETGENIICPDCGRTFPNNLHYIRHKFKEHNKNVYKCQHCGKVFKDKTIMLEHEAAHLGQPMHKCDHCNYRANYKRNLAQHFKKVHYELYLESKRNRLLNEWGPAMGPKYARLEEVQHEYIV